MTGKMKSAKGDRHGRLTVIKDCMKETPSGRKAHYALCQCVCGATIEVLLASLRNGNTTSCGCAKVMDLSSEQFGKLTVIGNAEKIYYDPILETTISGIREKDGEYIAEINIKGKTHRIGKFKTREEAEAVRRKAEKKAFIDT